MQDLDLNKLGKLNEHDLMETAYRIIKENKEKTLKDSTINKHKKRALTKMIQYFESPDVEDFEKCAIIKEWINELK